MLKNKRIAIVCRIADGLSGLSKMLLEYAAFFRDAGARLEVVAQRVDSEAFERRGAVVRRLPGWPWGGYLRRRLFAGMADWLCGGERYDLVHGHGDCLSQDVLSLHNCVHAAHEAILGRPHPGSGAARLHERLLAGGRFKLLIANSEMMKRELISRFGLPEDKTMVIYPGYERERFSPERRLAMRAACRRELGLSEDELFITLVTSGDFEKRGVPLFLQALGRAASALPKPWRAAVVGKESKIGPYLSKARAAGICDRVSFYPPVPEVERYYFAADLHVHPAHYEEFGITVLEAMACGLAVISHARVGACELMSGAARQGLLETLDAESLAGRIIELAGAPLARERAGQAAAQAARVHDWRRHCEGIAAVYERVLGAKNR
ncbi:MAG: glycosyltransferase family 4 protein [Elusimicrobia bacterium]|nr:glycosyltransferase family 4 protein [Elusimicrobiota bacterium]